MIGGHWWLQKLRGTKKKGKKERGRERQMGVKRQALGPAVSGRANLVTW